MENDMKDLTDLVTAVHHLEQKIERLGSERAEIETAWDDVKIRCMVPLQQRRRVQLELTACTEEKDRIAAAHDLRLRENEGLLLLLENEKEERVQEREAMEQLRRKEQEKMEQIRSAELKKALLLMESQREESKGILEALRTKVEELQVSLNEKERQVAALKEKEKENKEAEIKRMLEELWGSLFFQLTEDLKKKDEAVNQAREALKELDRVKAETSEHIHEIEEANRQLKEQLLRKEEEMLRERELWKTEKEQAEIRIQKLEHVTKKEKVWRKFWRTVCGVFRRKVKSR